MTDPVDDSLFFAGSEDEANADIIEEAVSIAQQSEVDEPMDSAAPSRQSSEPLFLPESDEENDESREAGEDAMVIEELSQRFGKVVNDADDIEILEVNTGRSERASSLSSVASMHSSSQHQHTVPERPNKKRRLSLEPTEEPSHPPFESAFLGTFIVGHAWSTVKGKGYIKVCLADELPGQPCNSMTVR